MKKAFLFFPVLFFIVMSSSAQIDSIKNYPLRDYIAPDIKYQRMDLYTGLFLNGVSELEDNADNVYRANLNLNYYEYINLSKFQGISDIYFYSSMQGSWQKQDTSENSQTTLNIQIDYYGQNRIYKTNETFWGIHGQVGYHYSPYFSKNNNENYQHQLHHINFVPYFSFGKGRIQPIESARQALDILISLQQNGRLSKQTDKNDIDSLARVANRIRYKRFYDQRFKRIYQLEELDKAIQNMDLVDSLDMIYFANLSDIWDYAGRYKRGSGLRIEGGLIPDLNFWYSKHTDSDQDEVKTDHSQIGIYGFVSMNRMRPISYAWQSDLMIDLTFGYGRSKYESDHENAAPKHTSDYLNAMLNASWQFGFYPNTRTFLSLTPFSAFTYLPWNDVKDERFGWASGLKFESYYYVSPRFRLSFDAGVTYADNLDASVPSPFWNTVFYNGQYLLNNNTNDIISNPVDATRLIYNKLEYYFSFTLRYAIF